MENHNLPLMNILRPNFASHQDINGATLLIKACQDKNEKIVFHSLETAPKEYANFFYEDKNGESAYKVLKRKRSLPKGLQALKEKLILDQPMDLDNSIYHGL